LNGVRKLRDDILVLQELILLSNKLKGTVLHEHLLLAYEVTAVERGFAIENFFDSIKKVFLAIWKLNDHRGLVKLLWEYDLDCVIV